MMPKVKLARLCYNITKSKLPRLRKTTKKYASILDTPYARALPVEKYQARVKMIQRKKKRKFSRKQLAAQRLFAKRARAGTLRRR